MIFLLLLCQAILLVYCQDTSLLSSLSAQPRLSNFTALVRRYAGLIDAISGAGSGFTVIAPTDAALATYDQSNFGVGNITQWQQAILSYHILRGVWPYQTLDDRNTSRSLPTFLSSPEYTNVTGGQVVISDTFNGAALLYSANKSPSRFIQQDILFTGGLIHIVDAALQLPRDVYSTLNDNTDEWSAFAALFKVPQYQNYITNGFGNLTYRNDMTYIVENSTEFAASINNGTYQVSDSQALQNIQYYMIGSAVYTSLMTNGSTFQSVQGTNITVTVLDGDIYLNAAKIVASDYLVSNGVMQVINRHVSCTITTTARS
ncbi:hypothetical protein LTR17_015263 [Elasticomyces elasticus]|nr:hypothetical protein LTR17_015263 [Elasticomyces elasticus]